MDNFFSLRESLRVVCEYAFAYGDVMVECARVRITGWMNGRVCEKAIRHACVRASQSASQGNSCCFTHTRFLRTHTQIHFPLNNRCTNVFTCHFSMALLFLLLVWHFANTWIKPNEKLIISARSRWTFVDFVVVTGLIVFNHQIMQSMVKTLTINKMSNNLKSRQPICNLFFHSVPLLPKRKSKKQLTRTQRQRATIIMLISIRSRTRRRRGRRIGTKRYSSITVYRHHHNNNKSNNSRCVWPIHRISNLRLIFRIHFNGQWCGEVFGMLYNRQQ